MMAAGENAPDLSVCDCDKAAADNDADKDDEEAQNYMQLLLRVVYY